MKKSELHLYAHLLNSGGCVGSGDHSNEGTECDDVDMDDLLTEDQEEEEEVAARAPPAKKQRGARMSKPTTSAAPAVEAPEAEMCPFLPADFLAGKAIEGLMSNLAGGNWCGFGCGGDLQLTV